MSNELKFQFFILILIIYKKQFSNNNKYGNKENSLIIHKDKNDYIMIWELIFKNNYLKKTYINKIILAFF